ncbi:MAG TPA: aminotransferase class IV family protein [Acidimicrobiales bacterium]|nr:aminotransferase class IV family protein [Acidimicrobiales bacterium]
MTEFNGEPAEVDQLRTLALTNYGHFTSMLVDNSRVRGLVLHMERLSRDCRRLFGVDLDLDRVRYLVGHALLDVNQPIVVRVTVFDPHIELGRPGTDADPGILVTTRPAAHASTPPMRLQSAAYCREMPEVKHVGLFRAVSHRRAAQLNGYDDAVFTDQSGNLSEAATTNVGFVDGDRIVWPKADILAGVTMALLSEAHAGATATEPVNLGQLGDLTAAFATNAVVGVRAISAIDNTTWAGDHPMIDTLRREYLEIRPEPL